MKPDYRGGSIVNLMSSIVMARGGRTQYKPLAILKPDELDSRNILLLVVDGLGYEFLRKRKYSYLLSQTPGRMTSVFPTTTSAAITSFLTGVAPQQHAFTGWNVYLREVGVISSILPFTSRPTGLPMDLAIPPGKVFTQKPVFDKMRCMTYSANPAELVTSDYTLSFAGKAKLAPFNDLKRMNWVLKKITTMSNRRKFIYAYWPKLDSLQHAYGTRSKNVISHFRAVDRAIRALARKLKDTTMVVTADHGFVDTKHGTLVSKELYDCLAMPLAGDARVAHCYVRPSRVGKFERYVKTKLKRVCDMHHSEDLVKQGYFGLGKPSSKLFERIGDYMLLMKEGYALKDFMPREKKRFLKGNHGGLTEKELFVPLVVINR